MRILFMRSTSYQTNSFRSTSSLAIPSKHANFDRYQTIAIWRHTSHYSYLIEDDSPKKDHIIDEIWRQGKKSIKLREMPLNLSEAFRYFYKFALQALYMPVIFRLSNLNQKIFVPSANLSGKVSLSANYHFNFRNTLTSFSSFSFCLRLLSPVTKRQIHGSHVGV